MYDIIYILLVEVQVRHTNVYGKLESSWPCVDLYVVNMHVYFCSLVLQIWTKFIAITYIQYICVYTYMAITDIDGHKFCFHDHTSKILHSYYHIWLKKYDTVRIPSERISRLGLKNKKKVGGFPANYPKSKIIWYL